MVGCRKDKAGVCSGGTCPPPHQFCPPATAGKGQQKQLNPWDKSGLKCELFSGQATAGTGQVSCPAWLAGVMGSVGAHGGRADQRTWKISHGPERAVGVQPPSYLSSPSAKKKCDLLSHLLTVGQAGSPGVFSSRGTGTEGKVIPQSCSPVCSSESSSASSEESVEGCKKAPHQLTV